MSKKEQSCEKIWKNHTFSFAAKEEIASKGLKESEMNPPLHRGRAYLPTSTEEA